MRPQPVVSRTGEFCSRSRSRTNKGKTFIYSYGGQTEVQHWLDVDCQVKCKRINLNYQRSHHQRLDWAVSVRIN